MTRKHIDREQIVKTTIQMIDRNGGTKDVTLREIAKELNCAHTNLYNYFNNLNEIYWEALGQVILMMLKEIERGDGEAVEPQEKLFANLERLMDFYIDHPGWYRLTWLEPLTGSPPPTVAPILAMPSRQFAEALMLACKDPLKPQAAARICDILFKYIYGELGIFIYQRSAFTDRATMKVYAAQNVRQLLTLLMGSDA